MRRSVGNYDLRNEDRAEFIGREFCSWARHDSVKSFPLASQAAHLFITHFSQSMSTFGDLMFHVHRYFAKLMPGMLNETRNCFDLAIHEFHKSPPRYDIINYLLSRTLQRRYLEIGVRNPAACFKRIEADFKLSVDPGYEVDENLADIPLTSDQFFAGISDGSLQLACKEFDVIFIDGLHLADQAYCDITNALERVAKPGFIVLHDCNPPTRHHAREDYKERGPAGGAWNGTTWKAIQRFRTNYPNVCHTVDSDWGVTVIESHRTDSEQMLDREINPFYEYAEFDRHRKQMLNLVSFDELIEKLPG